MKVLFVGDVHNKLYIFDDVERLDKEHNFDKIIFMGDYVDDWKTNNYDSQQTLLDVLTLKKSNPDKYILLLGNHCLSYLGYPCSGHKYEQEYLVSDLLKSNIKYLDLFTTVECGRNIYVCTHAGITNSFINNVLGGEQHWNFVLDSFNKAILKNLLPLTICGPYRGGSYNFSSFVWCDSRELCSNTDPIIPYQIVGHTPVENINIINGDSYSYIFIDTHSTYRDGRNIGDKSYLFWNEDKFEILY